MKTCATCQHFKDAKAPRGFGSCDRWHTGYGTPVDVLETNEVLVESDEGWCMVMGPDFGCVLHAEKVAP